jgi:hypothetical protein
MTSVWLDALDETNDTTRRKRLTAIDRLARLAIEPPRALNVGLSCFYPLRKENLCIRLNIVKKKGISLKPPSIGDFSSIFIGAHSFQ